MYMHKTLQRQELDYQIFVVNQVDDNPFNRAKLLNVGFMEALKMYDWECFVFHDVDLGAYNYFNKTNHGFLRKLFKR